MITWAIIATAAAAGLGYILIKQLQQNTKLKEKYKHIEKDYRATIEKLSDDVRKLNEIIKAIEEVNREAAKKKRGIRNSDDPARSATDSMRKLAADSSRSDETSTGD